MGFNSIAIDDNNLKGLNKLKKRHNKKSFNEVIVYLLGVEKTCSQRNKQKTGKN